MTSYIFIAVMFSLNLFCEEIEIYDVNEYGIKKSHLLEGISCLMRVGTARFELATP